MIFFSTKKLEIPNKKSPLKFIAFTDQHLDQKSADTVIKKIKETKPDLLVCAGDESVFGRNLQEFVENYKSFSIPLLIIPGNHEDPAEIRALARKLDFVHDLHLKCIQVNDILFIGSGAGGFSTTDYDFERKQKKFLNEIKKFRKNFPEGKIVFVTHAPPYNTTLDTINRHQSGVKAYRDFIETAKPNYYFCGHLHENENKTQTVGKTKIINPGKNGKIISL